MNEKKKRSFVVYKGHDRIKEMINEFVDRDPDSDEMDDDTYTVLLDPKTGQMEELIRDMGAAAELHFRRSDLVLFETKYLPLPFPLFLPAIMGKPVEKIINEAIDLYDEEMKKAAELGRKSGKKPIFLYREVFGEKDSYMGYLIDEGRIVTLQDFKTYKGDFIVKIEDECRNSANYIVYVPSSDFVSDFGLSLDRSILSHITAVDKWYPRDTIAEKDEVVEKIQRYDGADEILAVYRQAVKVINEFHTKDMGNYDKYYWLEQRFERFEQVAGMFPPDLFAESVNLIRKSLAELGYEKDQG